MEIDFKFKISLGYGGDVELWIEIPEKLHQQVCDAVGKDRMARYEFCFHFSDYLKEHFPELDLLIHEKIDEWEHHNYGHRLSYRVLHFYGLVSQWFNDEF